MAGKKKEQLEVSTRKEGKLGVILGLEEPDFVRINTKVNNELTDLQKKEGFKDFDYYRALAYLKLLGIPNDNIDGEMVLIASYLEQFAVRFAIQNGRVQFTVMPQKGNTEGGEGFRPRAG